MVHNKYFLRDWFQWNISPSPWTPLTSNRYGTQNVYLFIKRICIEFLLLSEDKLSKENVEEKKPSNSNSYQSSYKHISTRSSLFSFHYPINVYLSNSVNLPISCSNYRPILPNRKSEVTALYWPCTFEKERKKWVQKSHYTKILIKFLIWIVIWSSEKIPPVCSKIVDTINCTLKKTVSFE